jgi:hypothetical protein
LFASVYAANFSQPYFALPDQTRPRASSGARSSGHKLREQYKSWVDQLTVGRVARLLPAIDGLHLFLGELSTRMQGGTPEQKSQPYADAYCRGSTREVLLNLHDRLDVLAGAESLFATMNETNRQDVQGVIAALKISVRQELAQRGISVPLTILAGRLNERQLHANNIVKAWLWLDESVQEGHGEGFDQVTYLQAGLERLPRNTTRVFATVLAPHVPPEARQAHALLQIAVHQARQGRSIAMGGEFVEIETVRQAVRGHIEHCMNIQAADVANKLEHAVRPGVRTAEVMNRLWQQIHSTLDALGWGYLYGDASPDGDDDMDAVIEAQTEREFVRILASLQQDTAAACLARLDTERLLSMQAGCAQWSDEHIIVLGAPLEQACRARYIDLQGQVDQARAAVDSVLAQDRRVAVAHALMGLSDTLAARERYAARWHMHPGRDDDTAVDGTILQAAASLRLSGEPAGPLAYASLRGLSDSAFAALRASGDGQSFRGLALDPAALAAEVRRRSAPFDAMVAMRLEQISALITSRDLAPHAFIGLVVALALAEAARLDTRSAIGPGMADHESAEQQAFGNAISAALSRHGAAWRMQGTEPARHVAGMLGALRTIDTGTSVIYARDVAGPTYQPAVWRTAISILETLGRRFDVSSAKGALLPGADPYWNDARLPEIAARFGMRFDLARRQAKPLFGPMHAARLTACLGMQMARPEHVDYQLVALPGPGQPRMAKVEKSFHRAACQHGDISLSVDAVSPDRAIIARTAVAGAELGRQHPEALDRAWAALAGITADGGASLTRLMSAVATGVGEFTASARRMPAMARWLQIPEPHTARHIHFDVSELPRGEYRVGVSAYIDTTDPATEACLSFSLRADATGHRVKSLIAPPELRLLPAHANPIGDDRASPASTAGHTAGFSDARSGGSAPVVLAVGG